MSKTTTKGSKKPVKNPSRGRTPSKKQAKRSPIFKRGEETTLLEELFLLLSLSPDEERKLVKDIFISTLKRNICGDAYSSNPSGEDKDEIIIQTNSKDKEGKLAKADEKLSKVLTDGSREDTAGDGNYSNLKYGKSKYKNVESILKYVETPDVEGGVKLVIMNFND